MIEWGELEMQQKVRMAKAFRCTDRVRILYHGRAGGGFAAVTFRVPSTPADDLAHEVD
jgi:hypothetical protein